MRPPFLIAIFTATALHTGVALADYPHADEPIGTVRQVYDGALTPDLQVNTFRNIDRLFSTRTVSAGSTAYPLPHSENPLTSLTFFGFASSFRGIVMVSTPFTNSASVPSISAVGGSDTVR